MRLHSHCDIMYIPGNRDDLQDIIQKLKEKNRNFYILSAGSNIVFAEHISTPIINLMEIDDSIEYSSNDTVCVGASVRIQTLIRDLQKHNLGGVEYLFSVPSSVGGAIYMNAGRGRDIGLAISDYLEEVEYYSPAKNKFEKYKKSAQDFSYRHSPFQATDNIIVSATFRFREQDSEDTEKKIQERIEHSKKYLSADKPSCGSVFCEGNRFIYRLLMGIKSGGAMYSKKTPNWISNINNATASDVMLLIRKGEKFHKLFFSKYKVEVKYFE